jgi:4-hydroxybenzoate polyprenyltransferase
LIPAENHHSASRTISNKRSVIDFVIRNRIHLLPAAVLFVWAVPPWYGSAPFWNAAPSILLAGFGLYELNRVFDFAEDKVNDPSAYARTSATKTLVRAVAISAIAASIFLSIVLMNYLATVTLSIMILIGVLYSVPFLKRGREGRQRLKQIPGLKNAVPSVVWPLATILYPAMASSDVHPLQLWLAIIVVSCGIFTAEVAWDVRDSPGDQIAGISTLATTFGVRRAPLVPLVVSCVPALVIMFLVYYGNLALPWLFLAFSLVLLPTVAYLWKDSLSSNRDRSHLLVLINILALIPLGLVGRWVA